MTIEIHEPELENLIQQRMKSGAFRSIEDFLMHALIPAAPTARDLELPPSWPNESADDRPFWEVITERMKRLPDEVFDRLPEDGASQVDHYIYGHRKRD